MNNLNKNTLYFLKKIMIFGLPICFCFLLLEYKLSTIANNYTWKKGCIEAQLDSIKVLVLGSSHAFYGIDPRAFNEWTFNLANISQSLYFDVALTHTYIDRMVNLRKVIITVSDFSYGYELIDSPEKWRVYFYERYFNTAWHNISFFDSRRLSLVFMYGPSKAIKLAYFPQPVIDKANQFNGFFKIDTTIIVSLESGKARANYHNSLYDKQWVKHNCTILSDFIRELKGKHIEPVIIQLPVYLTYSSFIDKRIIKEMVTVTDSLCTINNIRFYNYYDDPQFSKSYFYDNDHLNSHGAQKVSRMINQSLRINN